MKNRILLICLILSLFTLFVSCPNGQDVPIVKDITTPIVVNGKVDTAITTSISIIVELEKGKFKAIGDLFPVSSWFSGVIVPGLEYKISRAVLEGATSLTIEISGTPTSESTASIDRITIPKDKFVYAIDDVVVNLPIGSSYNIVSGGSRTYSWHLYDLASFGDTSLSVQSPNKSLTKAFDKNALEELSDDKTLLAEGDTSAVKFEKGLFCRGYKLAGFNRYNDSTKSVSTDIKNLDYKVGVGINDVKIDSTTGAISFNLKNEDSGKDINLYAIWDVDSDAWGWTVKDDGTYQKTYDISGYNTETFENDIFPATFNLKKSGIAESDQSKYTDYLYYREAKVLSKDLKFPGIDISDSYLDLDDITFDYDFAIGEEMITGYMLDVLRDWNIGTGSADNPEKGYELPTEAVGTAPSEAATKDNNTLAYGTSYETGDYAPNNEKSDPITYVTLSQAIVISNAFTAYYNEKIVHTAAYNRLTYAYIKVDGTDEIKTISDADALIAKVNKEGDSMKTSGNTGFRLPTQEEWTLAARIVPESDYKANLTGAHTTQNGESIRNYMYPQITRRNMWSGADVIGTDSTSANTWIWYLHSTSSAANRTTHGFLNTSKDGAISNWTVIDKKPNKIGVYGMSGNVWEWSDTLVSIKDKCYRVHGGSFSDGQTFAQIGSIGYGMSLSIREPHYGIRLVRSL